MNETKKVLIEVEMPEGFTIDYIRANNGGSFEGVKCKFRRVDPAQAVPDGWKLREIIEVLAGLEGFIPETAVEGYLQRALKQIEEIAATPSPAAVGDMRVQMMREFIAGIAMQKPEKPDHWSSCGQCESNINAADELWDQLKDMPTAVRGEGAGHHRHG
jgi:hypothetical protein